MQTQQTEQRNNNDVQRTHMGANSLQTVKADDEAGPETVLILCLEIDAWNENQNWHTTTFMTDDRCEFNTVKQLIVKKLRLKVSDQGLTVINFDSHHMKIYRTVDIDVKIKNLSEQMLHTKKTFLVIQEASEDFVLELLFLIKHNSEWSYRKQQILWKSILIYNIRSVMSRATPPQLKEHQNQKILITDALMMTAEINKQSL